MIRLLSAAALLLTSAAYAADPSATKDGKELASPPQQKPAAQAQQPVPGPTPQETSRPGRSEERMNQQGQGTSGSGSSTPAQKAEEKKTGDKTQ